MPSQASAPQSDAQLLVAERCADLYDTFPPVSQHPSSGASDPPAWRQHLLYPSSQESAMRPRSAHSAAVAAPRPSASDQCLTRQASSATGSAGDNELSVTVGLAAVPIADAVAAGKPSLSPIAASPRSAELASSVALRDRAVSAAEASPGHPSDVRSAGRAACCADHSLCLET